MPMDTQISRRTLTSGALWAVPTAAVVGTVPAFAASTTTGPSPEEIAECGVTPEEVTGGTATSHQVARMMAWPENGGTSSIQFGFLQNGGIAINGGWAPSSACSAVLSENANILTYKVRNFSGESYLPAPTITDAKGDVVASTSGATLGNVSTGGYRVGFRYSLTIEFREINTRSSNPDPKSWDDLAYPLTFTVPVEVSYTATTGALQGKLIKRIIKMTFTLKDARRGIQKIDPAPTFSGGWTFPDPIKQPKMYIAD
ncbi:hypothetical protein O6R08_03875 [Cutibacterium equinum]|uniref:Tat pathway signal sequence domain protein n=1 Tax=Cutibacterium equinum TaxID=3016342 RepID=A0ABY7R008_9ACTN|nr:hypothetical protein [Cutibacterium equinum]WCC80636.1 hypothetical protein O6R08_03875 [Cutibacterium equinum]